MKLQSAIVAACLVVAGCPAHTGPAAARLPANAQLTDVAGGAFGVADRLHGRVAVLDFWASWCEECRRSVPQVARLASAFAGDGLVVIGVNEGDPEPDAQRSAKELGITYPIALDPELHFSDALGTTGLPVLVVIDKDGQIVHRAKHVDEETLALIRSLLHAR